MKLATRWEIDPERLHLKATIIPVTFGCWGVGPVAVRVTGLTWDEYGRILPMTQPAGVVLSHPEGVHG